ncbi:Mobile element protein [Candidatus Enterovibrio altilux]|uniref:Mobile element protein n=1 Tax=Candidatus Enterovibrio altilux TaxID=1927128 RepID=A0A291B7A0_9GAMM|nr:Mobile element protein [Candidatus Enterovibrio luxaltus]
MGDFVSFSDLAITMALLVKCVFLMSLRGLRGCINSAFKFIQLPLLCPYYSRMSRRAHTVNIACKTKTKGTIQHLIINFTGLQVYGEGA